MYLENNEAFATLRPMPDVDAIHIWRSKFLDKASKCETEIRRIAVTATEKKMPFKALAEKTWLIGQKWKRQRKASR